MIQGFKAKKQGLEIFCQCHGHCRLVSMTWTPSLDFCYNSLTNKNAEYVKPGIFVILNHCSEWRSCQNLY